MTVSALISAPICPLLSAPDPGASRADEALLGMEADILERSGGWLRLRTGYGYEGWAREEHLLPDRGEAERWRSAPRQVVLRGFCDVLSGPSVDRPVLCSLTRGCQVIPLEGPDGKGWVRVALPGGGTGYTKRSCLGEYQEMSGPYPPVPLRGRLAETALGYLGAPYRWGGKTPLGIDCSGLTFMAYWLCGVTIWRDAQIREGYPVRAIDPADMDTGDLLFFPGHVALCLGGGRYVHSTARDGSDGVVVNSLDPADPLYRQDLREELIAVGSIFS